MSLTYADLIEECSDHILSRYESYLFDHPYITQSEQQTVARFVEWCRQEDKHAIDTPRAPDGKSFRQRRDNGNG
jgi:hypothetical protein